MTARLRKLIADLGDAFWLIPSLMVLGGLAAAIGLVAVDASQAWSAVLRKRTWVYGGGATGARSLLGAIATSSITVAGTVFSTLCLQSRLRYYGHLSASASKAAGEGAPVGRSSARCQPR